MAACGMDPSGRGCSVTDCRPSDAVETLTTSPVTNVTVFTVGGPTRFGAGAGADGEAAAEPGADTSPAEMAATARTTVVRTVRGADGGMQESLRRGGARRARGPPGEPEVSRLTDLDGG